MLLRKTLCLLFFVPGLLVAQNWIYQIDNGITNNVQNGIAYYNVDIDFRPSGQLFTACIQDDAGSTSVIAFRDSSGLWVPLPGISFSQAVTAIDLEYGSGSLYVAVAGGSFIKVYRHTGSFWEQQGDSVPITTAQASQFDFVVDPSETMWIGVGRRLWRQPPGATWGDIVLPLNQGGLLFSQGWKRDNTLLFDVNGSPVFVASMSPPSGGTSRAGVFGYDGSGFQILGDTIGNGLSGGRIFYDSNQNLYSSWITSSGQLTLRMFDPANNTWPGYAINTNVPPIPPGSSLSLCADSSGRVFIGGPELGTSVYVADSMGATITLLDTINYSFGSPFGFEDLVINPATNALFVGFSEDNQSGVSDFSIMQHAPSPVSVQENRTPVGFGLWPNPASDQIMLDLKQSGAVRVCDLSGRELKRVFMPAGKNLLSTADLNSGTYLVCSGDATQRVMILR